MCPICHHPLGESEQKTANLERTATCKTFFVQGARIR
jgi:hypothetical protein